MHWITEDARKAYEDLRALRESIMDKHMARVSPPLDCTATALAMMEDPMTVWQEMRAECEPIEQEMADIAAKYTAPGPILVSKEGFDASIR